MKNLLTKLAIKYLQRYAKKKYGHQLRTKTKLAWEYNLQCLVIDDLDNI